ncbi:hypothetical protein NDU88_004511 [Pleurodeles waltl]|uniref:Uncharacterized protein n=1 Tax=Pleurodeles waltl TaxID=8319 RepID=A0AAV7T9Y0_PLEWA|nr:hypothetical protein NDU88_004511 [Pleurodeles waltl]
MGLARGVGMGLALKVEGVGLAWDEDGVGLGFAAGAVDITVAEVAIDQNDWLQDPNAPSLKPLPSGTSSLVPQQLMQ